MQNDWILDVLSDLKAFAAENGMMALAEQLDDTKLVAAADMKRMREKLGANASPETFAAGRNFKRVGASITA